MTIIRTQNLRLRPAKSSDAEALFDVYRRKDAMRYWDSLPHESLSETQATVAAMLARGKHTTHFVVEREGRAIGTAGFWRKSEIGYILHPDQWGKGFGRELLSSLISFGFDECEFTHITAETDPQNDVSNHMLRSAGFRETGRAKNTIQIGDQWFDSIYYQLDDDPAD